MAGKVINKMSVVVACLVALIQISSSFAATTWTVGDSGGWTRSGDYTTWASGKTFAVGDTLNFVFPSNVHTVTEVSKADYDACSGSNSISNTADSPANLKLTTTGAHYYICTFHCGSGQKLAITVSSSSTSTPSSPSPSSSTTPSTPSSTNNTSSGVVAGAGLVMPFLVGAAAFLM